MVVSSRIVLSLLGVLGAIQAGLSSRLRRPIFGLIRLPRLWSHRSPGLRRRLDGRRTGREGTVRGSQEARASSRNPAVRASSPWPRSASWWACWLSALLWFPVHSLPYIGDWVILPLFLVLGYLFALVGAKKHRGILRLVGVHQLVSRRWTPPTATPPRWSTRPRSSTDGSPTSSSTGFLRGELVVPEFVLRELQQVADSADPLKRNRGRRGLEVVQGLRGEVTVAIARRRLPRDPRGRLQAAQARQAAQPSDPHDRLQPEPAGADPGRRDPERERAGKRAQTGGAPRRAVHGAADPRGQGGRPGRRLSRRRHDGGGRGRPRARSVDTSRCRSPRCCSRRRAR